MVRFGKDEKSDGIEIVSIGQLNAGPWDKKYWSSSRGKERYPYPVGYKSRRTQNGVTYTMEILEGLKGPSFMISASDGKSCSGDTPDIAWESFQKKSCSKLWHGKRFACKIDGVEFFGFKNTFVQRLLRELVANVGGTAEQSLSTSNFSSGACETVNQLEYSPLGPDPKLLTYLVKSHVKGKRSKIEKAVNSKRLDGINSKQHQQKKFIKNASSSYSKQKHQTSCDDIPSTFAAANEASRLYNGPGVSGPENSAAVIENEICPPIAERGMQLDSVDVSDNLKVEDSLSQEERRPTSSTTFSRGNVDNLLPNQESSNRSNNVEVQKFNNIIQTERDEETNVQHDLPVAHDADMCAPDTLDHDGDRSDVSSPKNDLPVHRIVKDAIVKDVPKSEVLVTDSLPEDEICSSANNTSSEKFHIDSVGQEIAKSMMTLLLPQAVPLLKTFTRKKRKTEKPSNLPTHRSPEEKNGETIDVEKNEKAFTSCAVHESVISNSGNSDSVGPDSLDNDEPPPVLSHANAAKEGQFSCGPDHRAPIRINIRNQDTNVHVKRHTAFSDQPKRVNGKADMLGERTDGGLAPVLENTPNSKRARLDCQSLDKVLPIHASRTHKLPPIHASTMQGTSTTERMMCRRFSDICIPEQSKANFTKLHKDTNSGSDHSSSKLQTPSTSGCSSLPENNVTNSESRMNVQQKMKLNSRQNGLLELFACYAHPMPISMVQLIVKEGEVFVCVICGYSEHKESTLFFYKALKNGEKIGCPSLIGHAPIAFQNSENNFSRDIAVGRSLLQLTPDAELLVLSNSIKTPFCREGKLHCSCPACSSDCFEKNGLKTLRLNRGYTSIVTILETAQGVCCLLVCESNILLAAEEGGKLKLWLMNSGWSGPKEDCYLPTSDCMFPSVVELKKIPNSATLVVGHNGCGEFALWDIEKRNLVSNFSSLGMSVSGCLPITVFKWQRKRECKTKALVDEIMAATRMSFSERGENHIFSPEYKDLAVWLLISTASDPESDSYPSCEQEANPGCWRLALLANNMVITGSVVDGGAAAVTSGGHGVMGRCDGQVYTWELSTGMKLENLHSFKGSNVSCIMTDTSNSGALAIASEGQLLVYLQPS